MGFCGGSAAVTKNLSLFSSPFSSQALSLEFSLYLAPVPFLSSSFFLTLQCHFAFNFLLLRFESFLSAFLFPFLLFLLHHSFIRCILFLTSTTLTLCLCVLSQALKSLFTSRNTGIGRKGRWLTTEDLETYLYTFSQPGALTGALSYFRSIFR